MKVAGDILRWLVAWWPKLPKELRWLIVAAVLGGTITTTGIVSYMAWRDGWIQEHVLGRAIQKDVLEDAISDQFEGQTDTLEAVQQEGTEDIKEYLRDTLSTIRKNAKDSLLDPLGRVLTMTNRRLSALEAAVAAMSDQIDDQPAPDNAALYKVLDAIEGQPTNAEILRMIRAQNDSLQMLRDQLGNGSKQKRSNIRL